MLCLTQIKKPWRYWYEAATKSDKDVWAQYLKTSQNYQSAWQYFQGEVRWNTREIRVKYHVYPWNAMFSSEIGLS